MKIRYYASAPLFCSRCLEIVHSACICIPYNSVFILCVWLKSSYLGIAFIKERTLIKVLSVWQFGIDAVVSCTAISVRMQSHTFFPVFIFYCCIFHQCMPTGRICRPTYVCPFTGIFCRAGYYRIYLMITVLLCFEVMISRKC